MPIEARYHEQVRLLVSLLPFLNDEPCFALKGGTAINLFVQPLPRLSVDIDLAYLPLEPRDEALRRCREAQACTAYNLKKDTDTVLDVFSDLKELNIGAVGG